MPKKKKAPKGMTPEQVAKANRDGLDYAMEKLPPLQFEDVYANSNTMMGGLASQALPMLDTLISMGQAQTGYAPAEGTPNMTDLIAQLMPQQPQQPQVANTQPGTQQPPQVYPGAPSVGQPPQPGANSPNNYNLTPQQLAAVQQQVRGPGRGIV
jgi:hypothetical protein